MTANIQRVMLLKDKIAMILDEAVGRDLSQWEKDRLNEWKALDWGSAKQAAIVDKIGERLGLDFSVERD